MFDWAQFKLHVQVAALHNLLPNILLFFYFDFALLGLPGTIIIFLVKLRPEVRPQNKRMLPVNLATDVPIFNHQIPTLATLYLTYLNILPSGLLDLYLKRAIVLRRVRAVRGCELLLHLSGVHYDYIIA